VRDHLAAERTFLAWIRTGIALMGFGFVVARFGLFLQQLRVVQGLAAPQSHTISLWIGTALIAVGIVTNVVSARNHTRLVRELNEGTSRGSRPSTQAIVVALFLALVGLAMAIYLIAVPGSTTATLGRNVSQVLAASHVNLVMYWWPTYPSHAG
jgi:putative membrane protein